MAVMKYRILESTEWDRLKEIVDPSYIPHPDSATAAVAIDDSGTITGALFLQLALHMEPLILKTPKVSFKALHKTLLDAIQNDKGTHFYVFSDKEIVNKMAEHVGMKETPFKVYEGMVT
jgi:hypothetical protein